VNAQLTTRSQKLAVGAGVTVVAGVITAVAMHYSLASRNTQPDAHLTGTVQISVDGTICRRLVIDHRTGTVKSDERVPCADQGKEARAPKDAPRGPRAPVQAQEGPEPSRYSTGGRIDAVRNSFINR
jgi:hypothetical protein